MNHNQQANQICRSASSSGVITRTSVNILRRSFNLLGDATQLTVRAIDAAIKAGAVVIREDGSGVFDQHGRRIGD